MRAVLEAVRGEVYRVLDRSEARVVAAQIQVGGGALFVCLFVCLVFLCLTYSGLLEGNLYV